MNGRHLFKKAQSSLELVVALVAVFILLLGSVKIFVWLNGRMALRQQGYEASRRPAASDSPGTQVNESDHPLLNVFGDTDWVFATPTNDQLFGVPADSEIPVLAPGYDEFYVGAGECKYFQFTVGATPPPYGIQVCIVGYAGITDWEGNPTPRGQTDMLIKKGSPPTMEDYALAMATSPSEAPEGLYYRFTTSADSPEFVQIRQSEPGDVFYVMLFNPTDTRDIQNFSLSY